MISSTGATENSFLYQGEQFDKSTGLYYLRARYRNPTNGTFTTMDTYQGQREDPVSLHKYLYANANPVSNSDPTGYFSLVGIIGGSKARAELDSITTPNYAGILGYLLRKIATFAIEIIKRVITVYLIDILIDFTIDATVYNVLEHELEKELQVAVDKAIAHSSYGENYTYHEHHIVAQADPRAAASRLILYSVGLDTDRDENKVKIRAVLHWHVHSGEYHILIFLWLYTANNEFLLNPNASSPLENFRQRRQATLNELLRIKDIFKTMNGMVY